VNDVNVWLLSFFQQQMCCWRRAWRQRRAAREHGRAEIAEAPRQAIIQFSFPIRSRHGPRGEPASRGQGDDDDPANDDHTLSSSIANLGQLRYIVRGYDNPIPQLVDLKSTASGDHVAVWRAGRVAHGDPHGYGPGLP
jgi:hypothetical protein